MSHKIFNLYITDPVGWATGNFHLSGYPANECDDMSTPDSWIFAGAIEIDMEIGDNELLREEALRKIDEREKQAAAEYERIKQYCENQRGKIRALVHISE